MALTQVSSLSNSVVTKYKSDYLAAAFGEQVWGQFVDWEAVPNEGGGGSTYDYLAYNEMAPALTALTEDSDVVPVALSDSNLVVTPAEYGNSVATTAKLRFQSRANVREAAAKMVGQNQTRSVDRLIRNGVMAGTNIRYPSGVGVRTGLDATNDKVSYAMLVQLCADAIASDIEPWEGGLFLSVVHPLLYADLLQLTETKSMEYFRPNAMVKGFNTLNIGGFRFAPHKWGKLYMSGGTTAQAATTLASAAAAGATSVEVASATGLAVGDYITLGTLEAADAEQVIITVVASTTLTVQGGGNTPGNVGLKYAHAIGAAVTEAANVCALPVIGRNSIKGVYGQRTGKYGEPILKEGLDLLNRFIYNSWYWYGGVGIWQKYLIRGEVAVSGGLRGGE